NPGLAPAPARRPARSAPAPLPEAAAAPRRVEVAGSPPSFLHIPPAQRPSPPRQRAWLPLSKISLSRVEPATGTPVPRQTGRLPPAVIVEVGHGGPRAACDRRIGIDRRIARPLVAPCAADDADHRHRSRSARPRAGAGRTCR